MVHCSLVEVIMIVIGWVVCGEMGVGGWVITKSSLYNVEYMYIMNSVISRI